MKSMLLTIIALLFLTAIASASVPETVTLRHGQQKQAAGGEITIKFVSVTEDSRCPKGAQCVWSGNAKVQVKVANRGGGSKMMVMNTDQGPKGDQYDGLAVYLTSLTPVPRANVKIAAARYIATFSVTRLTR